MIDSFCPKHVYGFSSLFDEIKLVISNEISGPSQLGAGIDIPDNLKGSRKIYSRASIVCSDLIKILGSIPGVSLIIGLSRLMFASLAKKISADKLRGLKKRAFVEMTCVLAPFLLIADIIRTIQCNRDTKQNAKAFQIALANPIVVKYQ